MFQAKIASSSLNTEEIHATCLKDRFTVHYHKKKYFVKTNTTEHIMPS